MKAKKIVTLLVAAALTCGVVGSTTSVYAADVTLKLAHAVQRELFSIRVQLLSGEITGTFRWNNGR